MSPAMAARWLIVCVLATAGSRAYADRRPVAVIALTADARVRDLARELGTLLIGHRDLQPVDDPSVPGELFGELADEDKEFLAAAKQLEGQVEQALAQFKFDDAAQRATEAETKLTFASPAGPTTLIQFADLSFLLGQVLLGQQKTTEAVEAFAVVHRLDPMRTIEPGRYIDEVVAAFETAKRTLPANVPLEIKGSGRVWLDRGEVGDAPMQLDVVPGVHVLWLTGPEQEVRGEVFRVAAGKPRTIEIPEAPISTTVKLRRFRTGLAHAPDSAARSTRMHQIAKLVGVHDAILLSVANDKIIIQTWRDPEPGFSALRALDPKEAPADLLTPFAPKPITVEPPPLKPLPPLFTVHWYAKRTWQATILLGVVAAIVGGIEISHLGNTTIPPPLHGSFDPPALGRH